MCCVFQEFIFEDVDIDCSIDCCQIYYYSGSYVQQIYIQVFYDSFQFVLVKMQQCW